MYSSGMMRPQVMFSNIFQVQSAPIHNWPLNKSLHRGIFPYNLRDIFKKGNYDDSGNYCPVLLLPVFSKISEEFVYNGVNKHLSTIAYSQFCFKKASNAIFTLTHMVLESPNQKQYPLAIF